MHNANYGFHTIKICSGSNKSTIGNGLCVIIFKSYKTVKQFFKYDINMNKNMEALKDQNKALFKMAKKSASYSWELRNINNITANFTSYNEIISYGSDYYNSSDIYWGINELKIIYINSPLPLFNNHQLNKAVENKQNFDSDSS